MSIGNLVGDFDESRPAWQQSPRAAEYAKSIPHDQRANITTAELVRLMSEAEELRIQSDALLAACKSVVEAWYRPQSKGGDLEGSVVRCSSAIALAEGEAKP